ncbi:ISAs1 family transposase [Geodermatophilus sp. TF02-6]|uniref:ISAs1 family transposase n=1 Tax=Geodermatophilus sp. TF02-6 TaxID=2250575 RepID=UPI0013145035|nr:ISAs1 family transposase [Geodermatophilus sp. TF02-6]
MPALPSSLTALAVAVSDGEVPPDGLSLRESVQLLTALAGVPDPRERRGVRYSVQSVLLLAIGAVMAGKTSLVAIAGWAARADHQLVPIGRRPSTSTFGRVLAAVDPIAVQRAIDRWTAARLADAGSSPSPAGAEVMAVDGKVLRGARTADGQVKLVAAYDQQAGLVRGQMAVQAGDEIAALPAVLDTVGELHGLVVTADALHCQDSHAHWLAARGAHYVFTVMKRTRPKLHAALAAQPWGSVPGVKTVEVGHGRRESRSIKVLATDGQPALQALFPHAAQIAKIVRVRTRGDGKRSQETVYIVTSLTHRQDSAGQLAGWVRGQWTIENGLHWVRDVTLSEDACQVRTGHAPTTSPPSAAW